MDWPYLLTSFDGRINRRTFWIALIVVTAAEVFCHIVAYRIEGERLSAIVDLAFTYPEFAIAAKRAQDRNMPAWVVGIFFAAGVLLDFITVIGWSGTIEQPNPLVIAISLPFTIFGLALLADLGFRRGTQGPNRYGPDPLARAGSGTI
jgi:uncharacterized membrane protein YhaH (DUF805 family)